MNEEKWMYTSGARSTTARLDRLAAPACVIDLPAAKPSNSTVTAGWICCGFGVLCAWLPPYAHFFFGVAVVLAIVGMSTHQVRQGTILLVTTLACAAITFLIWMGLFVGAGLTILDRVRQQMPLPVQSASAAMPPSPNSVTPRSTPGTFVSNPRPAAILAPWQVGKARPVTMEELSMMLRTGYSDDEVIAATQSRMLAEPITGSRAGALRSLGAGDRLIVNLRALPVDRSSISTVSAADSAPVAVTARYPAGVSALPAKATPYQAAPAVDYQAKDRRIQDLKTQIDELDEDIRRIRANPCNSKYWWHYAGSGNGNVNQPALDAYLKQLDQRRNDLRREKWRLEGR